MTNKLPLQGIRVVEFSHMVMGPTCGLILADLGADVIKVEPAKGGDNTRKLPGSGAGFFISFNRNKRSLALDVKSPRGLAVAKKLIARCDVLIENFRPGGMEAIGLGYEAVKPHNPRLIYCSLKGFLSGPYENRAALDEVVQMMGGLAYMTGPPGRPLRAGAPVNDMMGGMFAVIGILAALRQREESGEGSRSRARCSRTPRSSSPRRWRNTRSPASRRRRCRRVFPPGRCMTCSIPPTTCRFSSAS